jgi:subtilisin family serine protease
MKHKNTLLAAGIVAFTAGLAGATPDAIAHTENPDALRRAKEALAQNPDLDRIPNQIIVRFNTADAHLTSAARALVNGQLIRKLKGVDGLEHLEVGMSIDRAIDMLNALPFVEYAEPDYVVRAIAAPNDQFVSLQWGVNNTGQDIRGVLGVNDADIDGYEGWDIRTSAANIVVAVIDSGTQWNHPDLDSNIWSNADEIPNNGIDDDNNGYIDDIRGWDFYNNDNNPDDADGHGTHVAGTIGAEGNNGIGVAGVAWDVQIMPLRFIGPFGGSTSDAIDAVNYAVANGAQISNNSWGGGGFSNAMRDAISNAGANGHLFVAAAGNDGVNTDSVPHYPSSYNNDNIISVAGTDNRGLLTDNNVWASNYGASSVDIGAPGNDIASTYSGSSYVWSSGTSMASPHVSGAAALVWAQNPGWTYAQVRDKLLNSATPNASLAGKCVTGAVLNLHAALSGGGGNPTNTAPNATIASPGNNATFTQGASISFVGSASDNEDGNISAALVWTSSINGQIGTGASFSTSGLSIGTHTITASVSDSGGLFGNDSISITIEQDQPPVTPPATPGRPNASITGETVNLDWSDNSNNESGFEIRRQERVGRNWTNTTIVGTTGANDNSFSDAPGNGRWRYSVRAFNSAGNSSWSSWRTVRVQ